MALTKSEAYTLLKDYLWQPMMLDLDGEEYEVLFFDPEDSVDKGISFIYDHFGTESFNPQDLGIGNLAILGVEAEIDDDPDAIATHDLDVIMQAGWMYFIDLDNSSSEQLRIMQADVDGGAILENIELLTEDFNNLKLNKINNL